MDADLGWCPACARQIIPKRITVTTQVPIHKSSQPPPPPPSSPLSRKQAPTQRKAGLVNGTGRLRLNGTIRTPPPSQQQKPEQPATRERKRLVRDDSPLPMYCSEECKIADMHSRRRTAPFNPESDDPEKAPPVVKSRKSKGESTTNVPSDPESENAGESDSSVDKEKEKKKKNAEKETKKDSEKDTEKEKEKVKELVPLQVLYGWDKPKDPPPPPTVNKLFAFMPRVNIDHIPEPPSVQPKYLPTPQYNGGAIMAGRLLNNIAPDPIKPREFRWDAPVQRQAPVRGWNDGSNTWRDALNGNGYTAGMDTDPYGRAAKELQRVTGGVRPVPVRPDPIGKYVSVSLPSDAALKAQLEDPDNLRITSGQMMGRMQEALGQRSAARCNMYSPSRANSSASVTSSPVKAGSSSSKSPPSPTIMRRERSLVSPGAEGMLLVPDVKLTVRSASASCLPRAIGEDSSEPIPISRRSTSNGSHRSSRVKRTVGRSPLSHEHGGWLGPHLSSSLEDEAAEKEMNRDDDVEDELEIVDGRETAESAERRRKRRAARRHMEVFEREERERERLFGHALTSIRPVQTTRAWSYDSVKTYDAMPMEIGKPLFRFAPQTIRIAPCT